MWESKYELRQRLKLGEIDRDRAREGWERTVRNWIAVDILAGKPIRALHIHTPPGTDLETLVKEERDRLKLMGHEV